LSERAYDADTTTLYALVQACALELRMVRESRVPTGTSGSGTRHQRVRGGEPSVDPKDWPPISPQLVEQALTALMMVYFGAHTRGTERCPACGKPSHDWRPRPEDPTKEGDLR
jgi:hypothetical protein